MDCPHCTSLASTPSLALACPHRSSVLRHPVRRHARSVPLRGAHHAFNRNVQMSSAPRAPPPPKPVGGAGEAAGSGVPVLPPATPSSAGGAAAAGAGRAVASAVTGAIAASHAAPREIVEARAGGAGGGDHRRRLALLQSLVVVGRGVAGATHAATPVDGSDRRVGGLVGRRTREGSSYAREAFKTPEPSLGATLPDDDSWQGILRRCREDGTQFTDPDFPPDETSIYHDGVEACPEQNRRQLAAVKQWRRVRDVFSRTEHISMRFFDEEARLVTGLSGLTEEEFNDHARQDGVETGPPESVTPMSSPFVETATAAVTSAFAGRREEHLGMLHPEIRVWAESLCEASSGPAVATPPDLDDGPATRSSGAAASEAAHAVGKPETNFDDFWGRRAARCKPLVFSAVEGVVVRWIVEEGFAAVVRVSLRLRFLPADPRGVRLFARDEAGGPFVMPGDVVQGALADCYFLGALSTVADNERLLLDVFPDVDPELSAGESVHDPTSPPSEQQVNDEGVYAVRFWRDGRWRVVVVDDWLPCDADGFLCFAQSPRERVEIWPIIAEKAYAKLNGCYENIIAGLECLAMQDLVSGAPMTHYIGGERMEERWAGEAGREELWAFLNRTLLEGALLSTSADVSGHGVMKRHAYGILNTEEVEVDGVASKIIKLRNPWGGGHEWDGAWRDRDPRWQRVDEGTKRRLGWSVKQDGTWWMDLADYMATFTRLELCELLRPPVWRVHRVIDEWAGETGAGVRNAFRCPQYQLHLPHAATVFVELTQPSRRPRGADEYGLAIAPLVAHGAEPDKRLVELQSKLLTPAVFVKERSCAVRLELEGSATPYAIVPCTLQENVESRFVLSVYTHGSSQLEPLSDESLPVCAHCGATLSAEYRLFGADAGSEVDRVHSACAAAYTEARSPRCLHCGEAIAHVEGRFSGRYFSLEEATRGGPGQVHAECMDAWRVAHADKCCHCAEPVLQVEGRFSGRFYSLKDDSGADCKCHSECYDAYRAAIAEKCSECGGPVAAVEGRFSGRFYSTDDGKIHEECWANYQARTADKCIHCSEPVVAVEGHFSGRFFSLDEGKVHEECYGARQEALADKCVQCSGPVLQIDGRYTGRFYPVEAGKVHEECWVAWQAR